MVRRHPPGRDMGHTAAMPGRRVVVGISVLGLAIAACAPGPAPAPSFSAPATPAPDPSRAAEPWVDLVWKPGALPGPAVGAHAERFTAVAAGPTGFVAVGHEEVGPDRHGIVRHSPDGASWTAVGARGVFDHVDLVDIEASGDGFVALGIEAGGTIGDRVQTALFRSADGRAWQRLPSPPGALDTFATALAASDAGVLVSAFGPQGGPVAWFAADGLVFQGVALGGDGVDGLVDPQAVPDGFVALGPEGRAPRLLHSGDGIDWTAAAIDGGPDLVATRVVAGRDALLVQGIHAPGCGPFSACGGDVVAWWSGDRTTWGRLPDDGSPVVSGASVVTAAGQHGFVAVDGASAWWSRDGWHWLPLPEPGDGRIVITDVAVRDDRIVAVGEESHEDGSVVGRILVGG